MGDQMTMKHSRQGIMLGRRSRSPKKAAQKRPHISAAARKRLSELMRKGWAERKKAVLS